MAITKYFDKKCGREMFKVRIIRRSSSKSGRMVDKRAFGIESEAEAKRREKTLLVEAERELIALEQKGAIWGNLLEEWELSVRGGDIFAKSITTQTMYDYLALIRTHTAGWMEIPADEIDRAQAWLVLDRVEREVSIIRRKRLRSAIDSVFNWAILSGRVAGVKELPTRGFKSNRREDEKLPEILNLSEIKTLLSFAKRIDHPWYPVWALALFTGMRSGELYALDWASVDFDNSMLYVHRSWTNKVGIGPTKGRYWRGVPIGPELTKFLQELKVKTAASKFVLPRFKSWEDGRQAEILREFCVGSGIPSIRFHTLRACFATQLIKDGVAPAVVMKIAGWKDLKTMQRYIRLAGVEIKGATDGLKLLPESEVMATVVNLFQDGQ